MRAKYKCITIYKYFIGNFLLKCWSWSKKYKLKNMFIKLTYNIFVIVTDLGGNTSCVSFLPTKPALCNTHSLEHPVQGH